MKKGMFVVLFAFAVLSVSSVGADTQVHAQPVGAAPAADTADNFVVADHFKMDTSDSAPVKIYDINSDFQSWFFGKTEEAKDVKVPRFYHELPYCLSDSEIVAYLGGEAKAEMTMAGIYELMKLQRAGEDDGLLDTYNKNIFYVRDIHMVLRIVYIYYEKDWYLDAEGKHYIKGINGWTVNARAFWKLKEQWHRGDRIFSY